MRLCNFDFIHQANSSKNSPVIFEMPVSFQVSYVISESAPFVKLVSLVISLFSFCSIMPRRIRQPWRDSSEP
jgi:hypothetical protein